jgi:hypothetical protein
MALDSVLANIPGYGGFAAKRQLNLQEERAGLQDVATKMGLLAKLQEQEKAQRAAALETQYRAELAAAPTPEAQIEVASKYASPEKLLTIRQGSADRAAQREVMIQAANDRRDQQQQLIELRFDQLAQSAATDAQRQALEKRRVEEIERNNRRHDETLRLLGQMKASATQQPKPPQGFRYTADGTALEPIPGGPKDTTAKDIAKARGAIQRADTVIQSVDEALKQTGPLTTGLPGQVLGAIPGTSAYDLDGTLDTIKANLGFAELQAMRDASPTGGALGQVAIQELNMLQSTLASLKRGLGRQKLEAGLKKVRQHMENWRKAVAEAAPQAPEQPAAPGGAPVPPTPAAPTAGPRAPAGVPEFATEAEAAAAAAAGQIKAGQKIRVGGRTGTWR